MITWEERSSERLLQRLQDESERENLSRDIWRWKGGIIIPLSEAGLLCLLDALNMEYPGMVAVTPRPFPLYSVGLL